MFQIWWRKIIYCPLKLPLGFSGGASGKEYTCQWRRHKSHGFNPWVRKNPGKGNYNPLQQSYLENPMERGSSGGLLSIGSERVEHHWSDLACKTPTHILTIIYLYTKWCVCVCVCMCVCVYNSYTCIVPSQVTFDS